MPIGFMNVLLAYALKFNLETRSKYKSFRIECRSSIVRLLQRLEDMFQVFWLRSLQIYI
jgi:hypothetical protein